MKPTRDQIYAYIETRFSGQRLTRTREIKLRCPFHDDSNPSFEFNTEHGVWKCHAGCGEGGLIDFEQKLNGGTREEAAARIAEVMHADHLFESRAVKPVAIYPYVDAQGTLLFEKCRYEPKRFVQRRPTAKGGYEYKLTGIEKPLYRLPEVLRADSILVVEGEKDADRVSTLKLRNCAATTNFDGAGKWKDKDSIYFAGKKAVIFPDNDDIGRAHAEQVALSVSKYAVGVRVVELPGLPPHGDISDWLDRGHTDRELVELVKYAPEWRAKQSEHALLAEACTRIVAQLPEIDWLVTGVIERGANGIITGYPKAGKSLVLEDLLIAVATGTPWLGFTVPRRVKCALVSREDYYGMTLRRLGNLWRGSQRRADFEGWLWLNTMAESPSFLLTDDAQVTQLIRELRMEQVEFVAFDVLRVLHGEDENDNTAMQVVLDQLRRIQVEAGCALALVHHVSKAGEGANMFRRIRGAGAIDGWTQWAMGVNLTNPDDPPAEWIRKIEFETKAACAAAPRYFKIVSQSDTMRLELSEPDRNSNDYLEDLIK